MVGRQVVWRVWKPALRQISFLTVGRWDGVYKKYPANQRVFFLGVSGTTGSYRPSLAVDLSQACVAQNLHFSVIRGTLFENHGRRTYCCKSSQVPAGFSGSYDPISMPVQYRKLCCQIERLQVICPTNVPLR